MLKGLKALTEKGRFIIVILTAILALAGVIATFFMLKEGRANSDMLTYLNKNSDSYKGLEFFSENFGIEGDAMLAVEAKKDDTELKAIIDGFWEIEGITQIIWYGTLEDFDIAFDILSFMLSLSGKDPKEVLDIDTLKDFLRKPTNDGYVYSVLVMINHSPASVEAANILKEIHNRLSPRGVSFAGMTYTADTVMHDTINELPFYLILGGIGVVLVLFLLSFSFIEPSIVVISILSAISVNLGLNYLFPTVSVISFAVSSLIQLSCVLTYAVFILRMYKAKSLDYFKEGVSLVLPSSLATALSFIPLIFMNFSLGYDLAPTLIKSVALTLMTVLLLTPALIAIAKKAACPFENRLIPLRKLQEKLSTLERCPKPLAYLIDKCGIPIALLSVILLATVLSLQGFVETSHFKLFKEKDSYSSHEIAAEKLANQLIVSVPVLTLENKSPQDCIKEIESLEAVDRVMSIFSAVKLSGGEINALLDVITVKELDSFFAKDANGDRYTLFTITLTGNADSAESVDGYNKIVKILDDYYGVSYRFGVVSAVADISNTVERDFWVINLIALALILLIYLIFTKSIYRTLVYTALLELAMLAPAMFFAIVSKEINFFIYILSGVQAYSMISYTFMLEIRVKSQKEGTLKQKYKESLRINLPIIMVSSLAFSAACLILGIVSQNLIVKEMAVLMALNSLCAGFVSTVLLPSIGGLTIR